MKKLKVAGINVMELLAYALSVVLLLIIFTQNRSLFLDSLNLARNIAEGSFLDLSLPLNYEQSAPVLFLYLTKTITLIFGLSEYTLRVIPLIGGLASLFLFGMVLNRFINSRMIWVGILWLGTHHMFLRYATEFKQYIIDLFVSIFLIWLILYFERINKENLFLYGIIGAIAIWLSMPSVFILAGVILYLFAKRFKCEKSYFPIFILAFWFTINFVLEYFLMLRPAIESNHMQNFHQNYFLQGRFWNIESLQHDFGLITSTIRLVVGKSGLAISISMLLIIFTAYSFFKKRKIEGILLIAPILAVFGASILGKYSLIERLMLFVLPLIVTLIIIGVQKVFTIISAKSIYIKYTTVGVLCLTFIIGYVQIQGIKYLLHPLEIEDNLSSLKYINESKSNSRSLICSQFAYPAYSYYTTYDKNYTYLNLGNAIAAGYKDDLIKIAIDQSLKEQADVWVLLGHLQEKEIDYLFSEFNKKGIIKNSYRTNRSAAILFSTQ